MLAATSLRILAPMGEALLLGLTTGPVCLASCGPVVVPWMLARPQQMRTQIRDLLCFLAARLAGYMLFAFGAWWMGTEITSLFAPRAWTIGGIQILLALSLLFFSVGWPRLHCHAKKTNAQLVQIDERKKHSGAISLGFLTGINFCPPFLVASVRAAQLEQLPAALLFFLCFFVGTVVWFAPYLFLGFIKRSQACVQVARIAAILLACWYGIVGASTLIVRIFHG